MHLFHIYANELGYTKIEDINNKIKKQIKNKICHKMNISYIYTEYELILNRNSLRDIVNNDIELNELKKSLNKNVIHKLNMSRQNNLKNYSIEDKIKYSDYLIKV